LIPKAESPQEESAGGGFSSVTVSISTLFHQNPLKVEKNREKPHKKHIKHEKNTQKP
jgi:hypothetical protein